MSNDSRRGVGVATSAFHRTKISRCLSWKRKVPHPHHPPSRATMTTSLSHCHVLSRRTSLHTVIYQPPTSHSKICSTMAISCLPSAALASVRAWPRWSPFRRVLRWMYQAAAPIQKQQSLFQTHSVPAMNLNSPPAHWATWLFRRSKKHSASSPHPCRAVFGPTPTSLAPEAITTASSAQPQGSPRRQLHHYRLLPRQRPCRTGVSCRTRYCWIRWFSSWRRIVCKWRRSRAVISQLRRVRRKGLLQNRVSGVIWPGSDFLGGCWEEKQ